MRKVEGSSTTSSTRSGGSRSRRPIHALHVQLHGRGGSISAPEMDHAKAGAVVELLPEALNLPRPCFGSGALHVDDESIEEVLDVAQRDGKQCTGQQTPKHAHDMPGSAREWHGCRWSRTTLPPLPRPGRVLVRLHRGESTPSASRVCGRSAAARALRGSTSESSRGENSAACLAP